MNSYELKRKRELLLMIRDLATGHLPAMYTSEIVGPTLAAIQRINKDITTAEIQERSGIAPSMPIHPAIHMRRE